MKKCLLGLCSVSRNAVAAFLISAFSFDSYGYVYIAGEIPVLIPPTFSMSANGGFASVAGSWDTSGLNPIYEFYTLDGNQNKTIIQSSTSRYLHFKNFPNSFGRQMGVRVLLGSASFDVKQHLFIPRNADSVLTNVFEPGNTFLVAPVDYVPFEATIYKYAFESKTCGHNQAATGIEVIDNICVSPEENKRSPLEFTPDQKKAIYDGLYKLGMVIAKPEIIACANAGIVAAHSKFEYTGINYWVVEHAIIQLQWYINNGFARINIIPGVPDPSKPNVAGYAFNGKIRYPQLGSLIIGPGDARGGQFDWTFPELNQNYFDADVYLMRHVFDLHGVTASATSDLIADTLIHEFMHNIGYTHHDFVEGNGTRDDPPYVIGDCVREYLRNHPVTPPTGFF